MVTEKKGKILTGSPPSQSVVVSTLLLSISQNLTRNSSPAAKKRFLVVSNWTTPSERFLKPLYVLLIAPSVSFHSTKCESPSLLVPQENSLHEKIRKWTDEMSETKNESSYIICYSSADIKLYINTFYVSPCTISTVSHGSTPMSRSIIVNSWAQAIIQPCLDFPINGSREDKLQSKTELKLRKTWKMATSHGKIKHIRTFMRQTLQQWTWSSWY